MKKLLLSLFVCFFAFTAMADMPINIGLHGGYSMNKMKLKDLGEAKLKSGSGYMVGAFMRLNLGKFYLEPALNYSHEKSEVTTAYIDYNKKSTFDLEMNTFDIPLMLGIQVLDLSILKLRAFLGPQISIGKLKNIKELGSSIDVDNTNWRGKVGVGIDVWKLTLDIDYEKGFKKIANEVKSPSSFNFTFGFKII